MLWLLLGAAQAVEVRAGERVVVAAGEVIDDDLYVVAGALDVDGTVRGDVWAVAGAVRVGGVVDGDLTTGARSVDVEGAVGGVRAATGRLRLGERAVVDGDVIGAGRTLGLGGGASVGRDLAFARPEPPPPALWPVASRMLGVLAVGGLVTGLAPRFVRQVSGLARRRVLASMGLGALGMLMFAFGVLFVGACTVLVASVLGLVSGSPLLGLGVGAVAAAAWVLVFAVLVGWVAWVVAGAALGEVLGPRIPLGAAFVAGAVPLVLLEAVPWVGAVLGVVVAVWGLGAFLLWLGDQPIAARVLS